MHVIRTRRRRSHEAFFVLAALIAVAVIFDWPGIGFYTVQAILTAD